jgi:hypothetical protein
MFVSLVFMSASQATYRVEFDEMGKPSLRQIITSDASIQTDDLEPQDMALFNHSASKFEEEKEQTKKKKEEFTLKEKLMTSRMIVESRKMWISQMRSYARTNLYGEFDRLKIPSENDFWSFFERKSSFDEIFETIMKSIDDRNTGEKSSLFKFYDIYNTNLDFTPWNK